MTRTESFITEQGHKAIRYLEFDPDTGYLAGTEVTEWDGIIINQPPLQITTADQLDALPPGSVVSTPFPDIEGNVAERTSDRLWLITGEHPAITSAELAAWAEVPFTVLRHGYGEH